MDSEKKLLVTELKTQEVENYEEGKINWLEDDFYDDWDKVIGHMKKLFGHKQEFNPEETWKPLFLAHSQDKIEGKALLIQNTKIRLPLIRQAIKKTPEYMKDEEGNFSIDVKGKKILTGNEVDIQSFYMIGEKFDRRYDGFLQGAFSLDFYQYVVETADDKKIFLFSEKKLPSESSIFYGMLNELDDYSEISRTMKIPSLSRIFFVKEAEPFIKTLPKDHLVKLMKEKKIDEVEWFTHLAKHPLGTINNFPVESEMVHSAQLLSGKLDGWPLHICYMGPQGTRKTMGKGETTEFLFSENKTMVDSGNSRLKGLSASYKGTIADPGYLAKEERFGIVDEIGKMVEAEINKTGGMNILGELNAILEHKERRVVSGNTSEASMKPTAKFLFITNPINNRPTIYSHVGLIDQTMMSRVLWWVQDAAEQDIVLGPEGIIRCGGEENMDKSKNQYDKSAVSESDTTKVRQRASKITGYGHNILSQAKYILEENSTPKDLDKHILEENSTPKDLDKHILVNNKKNEFVLKKSIGVSNNISRDIFLTIFDSCYAFTCDLDFQKIQSLVDMSTNFSKEPMRGVWNPRAFHHIYLIVDGIVKTRCLFRDYDPTFTPKEEDYTMAERILVRMVKSWDTDMSPKEGLR